MNYFKSISLENFRLFREETKIDLAGITYLVGKNNSGKSSLCKAILLLKENCKNFSFLKFSTGDHKLGFYINVLSKQSNTNEIVISLENTNDITYKLSYKQKQNNVEIGELKLLEIFEKNELIISIDLLWFSNSHNHDKKCFEYKISSKLFDYSNNNEMQTILREYNPETDGYYELTDLDLHFNYIARELKNGKNDVNSPLYSERNSITELIFYLKDVKFLPNNRVAHDRIYIDNGNENTLNGILQSFVELEIEKITIIKEFLIKWLTNFQIATNYEVARTIGISNTIYLYNNNEKTNIVDLGYGYAQLISILFKIANTAGESIVNDNVFQSALMIVEEPESNLHPNLQSKLADLFLDAHNLFNIQFIIETHSEYLIRKTQLIVKENKFEVTPNKNPFTVIYFDKDKQWKMKYREDGKFINDFGKGFFDESASLTIELY